MQLAEAIKTLKAGAFWNHINSDLPSGEFQNLCDAVDIALTCMENISRTSSALEALHREQTGKE